MIIYLIAANPLGKIVPPQGGSNQQQFQGSPQQGGFGPQGGNQQQQQGGQQSGQFPAPSGQPSPQSGGQQLR